MITLAEATKIALAYISKLEQSTEDPVILLESKTIEKPFGWVYFYDSKLYIETGEFECQLLGNAPLIINRNSGKIHVTGTAYPIEHYIEEYERAFG